MRLSFFSFIVVSSILFSCSQSFSDSNQYYKYIDDPSNGMVKSNTVNGFDLCATYLPSELVVLEDAKYFGILDDVDSAVHNARYKKEFLFSIKPNQHKQGEDILLYNIESEEEFEDRKRLLDFRFGSFFTLRCGNEEISPQLFYTQSGQVASNSILVKLVFVSENELSSFSKPCDFELLFLDPVFGTGKSVFSFLSEDIIRVPKLRKN